MKKMTMRMCWCASVLLAVAVAVTEAQQSSSGAGSGAGAAPATGQAQQQTLPAPQQGATTSGQNQAYQPGAPREQAGQLFQPRQPGIETRQNVITPDNRFGQQRGFNYQRGQADPQPTPAERQAQGLDAEMQTKDQRGPYGATGQAQRDATQRGERGELGVWLAAGAGPGVEIRRVTEGSAAEQIGLQPGDVLLQVNRRAVTSPMEVQRTIRAIPAGQSTVLEVWRDGNQQEVSVTLQPMSESYRSGYRGEEMESQRRGDIESRTMRLEEQLSMVMRELEQLRGEMRQLHPGSASRSAETAASFEEPAIQPQASPFDRITTPQPAPSATEPEANEANPFATETEAPASVLPATEPAATEFESATESPATKAPATESEPATEQPAEEPATEEPTEDLFGDAPAETKSEDSPPQESETGTETDADSLFE